MIWIHLPVGRRTASKPTPTFLSPLLPVAPMSCLLHLSDHKLQSVLLSTEGAALQKKHRDYDVLLGFSALGSDADGDTSCVSCKWNNGILVNTLIETRISVK